MGGEPGCRARRHPRRLRPHTFYSAPSGGRLGRHGPAPCSIPARATTRCAGPCATWT